MYVVKINVIVILLFFVKSSLFCGYIGRSYCYSVWFDMLQGASACNGNAVGHGIARVMGYVQIIFLIELLIRHYIRQLINNFG